MPVRPSNDALPAPGSLKEALARKLCTYTFTGETYVPQESFICNTCSHHDAQLVVCEPCALRCHFSHSLTPLAADTQAYCDCGSAAFHRTPHTPDPSQSHYTAPAASHPARGSLPASCSSSEASAPSRSDGRLPTCQALTDLPTPPARLAPLLLLPTPRPSGVVSAAAAAAQASSPSRDSIISAASPAAVCAGPGHAHSPELARTLVFCCSCKSMFRPPADPDPAAELSPLCPACADTRSPPVCFVCLAPLSASGSNVDALASFASAGASPAPATATATAAVAAPTAAGGLGAGAHGSSAAPVFFGSAPASAPAATSVLHSHIFSPYYARQHAAHTAILAAHTHGDVHGHAGGSGAAMTDEAVGAAGGSGAGSGISLFGTGTSGSGSGYCHPSSAGAGVGLGLGLGLTATQRRLQENPLGVFHALANTAAGFGRVTLDDQRLLLLLRARLPLADTDAVLVQCGTTWEEVQGLFVDEPTAESVALSFVRGRSQS